MSARSKLILMLPCHCCELEDVRQPNRTTEHHQNKFELAGKERVGDHASVPLCRWHHEGHCLTGMNADAMASKYGPSLYHDKTQFRACYGNDATMLALTNIKLASLLTEPA